MINTHMTTINHDMSSYRGLTDKVDEMPHNWLTDKAGSLFQSVFGGGGGGSSSSSGSYTNSNPQHAGLTYQSQDSANKAGQYNFGNNSVTLATNNPRPTGTSGGTSSGQRASNVVIDSGNAPQESVPGAPDMSFVDELLNPALESLNSFENETRTLLGGAGQLADTMIENVTGKAEAARNQGMDTIGAHQAKQEDAARTAENQQRAGLAEIQNQFAGRFGRSGFGQGLSASIADNTLQTIGRIRTGLQQTIQELDQRRGQLDDIFNTAVKDAEFEAANLKQTARAQLQQALGQINSSRIGLQTRKAEMVNSALSQYRQTVADINARNTAYQQQLYTMQQSAAQRIAEAQSRASNAASNLESFSFQPGNTYFIPNQQLAGEDVSRFAGTNIDVTSGDNYTSVYAKPEQESDPLLQALQGGQINFGGGY